TSAFEDGVASGRSLRSSGSCLDRSGSRLERQSSIECNRWIARAAPWASPACPSPPLPPGSPAWCAPAPESAAGNTLEAAGGASLVTRLAPASPAFSRPADVYAFTVLAALVSPAVSAVFGVTSLALGGHARWAAYGAIWATWWLGDAAGALIVAPPLLLWSAGRPLPWLHRRRLPEALVML